MNFILENCWQWYTRSLVSDHVYFWLTEPIYNESTQHFEYPYWSEFQFMDPIYLHKADFDLSKFTVQGRRVAMTGMSRRTLTLAPTVTHLTKCGGSTLMQLWAAKPRLSKLEGRSAKTCLRTFDEVQPNSFIREYPLALFQPIFKNADKHQLIKVQ